MSVQRRPRRDGFGTDSTHTRVPDAASVVDMAKASTPWGAATVVEELRLSQSAGGRKFGALVQLLEGAKGERLVRFAYATGGTARRGPVTLRDRDLERLRTALDEHPGLKEALMP
jgi:hypothetical protein